MKNAIVTALAIAAMVGAVFNVYLAGEVDRLREERAELLKTPEACYDRMGQALDTASAAAGRPVSQGQRDAAFWACYGQTREQWLRGQVESRLERMGLTLDKYDIETHELTIGSEDLK